MDIIGELRYFYDNQAGKFNDTRRKVWPEFEHILAQINDYPKDEIKILELGCGGGRLLGYLRENSKKKIDYVGVDISENLINIAKYEYPQDTFHVKDMHTFLLDQPQQDFDFVIAIASFQHIPKIQLRLEILKHIYKVLNYQGQLIMTNWSFSKWFFKRFYKQVFSGMLRHLVSFGAVRYNDLQIPWKSKEVVFQRYYHIFTISELKYLMKMTGFVIDKLGFVSDKGNLSHRWWNSRNTVIMAKKDIG